jgi:hypothetical protein
MNLNPNHPKYNSKPIRNIATLSKALKLDEGALLHIVENVESFWKAPYEIKKEDGSSRTINDAKQRLKNLHKTIYSQILSKVTYPPYITGSVKGHDYSSNADIHTNKSIVITEDIKRFFPSTSTNIVYGVWKKFFGFSDDVADLLTKLTTKDGCLPQGGVCSSYLANLAFWDIEGGIYSKFKVSSIEYSRYVDDITISSKLPLSKSDKTKAISAIYGMLIKKGYKPKRSKHEIQTQAKPMIVTKLMVNDKVSLTDKERNRIRSAVFQLEKRIKNGERGYGVASDLTKVSGRIGVLNRFHKIEGKQLKFRVKILRSILKNCPIHNTTLPITEILFDNSNEPPF